MCRAVSPQGRTPSSHWSSEGPWGAWFQLPQATVPWEVGSSLYGRERLLPKMKRLWGFPKIAGGGGGTLAPPRVTASLPPTLSFRPIWRAKGSLEAVRGHTECWRLDGGPRRFSS